MPPLCHLLWLHHKSQWRKTKWCSLICFKKCLLSRHPDMWSGCVGFAKIEVPFGMPWRRLLSNGSGCRQQPPTVGFVQVLPEWMEAFFRVQEAGWGRHVSRASMANCGECGSGRGRHYGIEPCILPFAGSSDDLCFTAYDTYLGKGEEIRVHEQTDSKK